MSRHTLTLVSLLVGAVAVTPALAQSPRARQGPQVTVVNTEANPVPVVIPALPLPVEVTAAAPLTVTGSVNVSDPAASAYVAYDSGTIASAWVNIQLSLGTVPEGTRLVVEHVGASCEMEPGDEISRATIWVNKSTGAGWSSYAVPLGVASTGTTHDGKVSVSISQSLRLYSDGGVGGIFVDIRRRDTTHEATCWAVVSGHTVDLP